MTRRYLLGVVVALSSLDVLAQAPGQTFVARGEGVRVDVLVTDGGHPVVALQASDFEVLDNGVPQRVDTATTAGHLSIAVVLDTSADIVFSHLLDDLLRSGQIVANTLQPGDRASLLVFSDRLSLPVVGTHDPKMLHQALAKLTAYNDGVRSSDFNAVSDWSLIRQFGRSAVWDAVYVGGSLVVGEDGRAIVVLLSNSQDTASWLLSDGPDDASWNRQERQKTVDGLVRSGIVVDTIWPSRSISARADFAYARPRPTAVSDATGGEAFYSRDDKLVQRLTSRFEALRSGYVITFTPTGVKRDDGWHRLTVRLKNKSGSVKARDRYFASAPAKSVGR